MGKCRSVVEKLLPFFPPALKRCTWVAVGCNESNSGLKKLGAGMQICECNSHMLETRVLELNGDEMNLGLYGTRLCFARDMDCLNYKGISPLHPIPWGMLPDR